MTLGTAAFALNYLAARTAENNLIELTTEQSMRDASIIAGIVNELLAEQGAAPSAEPAKLTRSIPIDPQNLLDSLRVIDISMYDPHGIVLWSTSADLIEDREVPSTVLRSTSSGQIASNLRSLLISEAADAPREVDVIETFLPLLAASGGDVVGVIGITRDVTSTLTAQIAETKSSFSQITLLSLGSVFLVLLVFIFIADIKIFRANIQKLRSERELGDRLMIESLEMKRVANLKDRFLSSVTHELMTPLTSISAFTDILLKNRNSNLREKELGQLQVLKRNTSQLQHLIDGILELSVMNRGEAELSYTRLNLRQMLDEVSQAFMPAIEKKRQKLELDYEEADTIVEADDTRVRQVISNILTNSIMYSPEGTKIVIAAWVTDLLFSVTVKDSGIGISDAERQELFTMFFRADNESTRSVAGTGIGLITSKQIVELHGGELSLQSTPGKGTTVQISMPRFRAGTIEQSLDDDAA
ncbi:MAG: HAMP domain-containing sensor histidine kinase [Chloroflexi bacterium]|nr:HAMP domain-containing sensor histidine kinase [Chloroflexota bacterium]